MPRAALIGSYENICIYKLAGFNTIEVSTAEEAQKAVDNLTKENTAVIFVEEDMMNNMQSTYKSDIPLIPIPFAKKENSTSLAKLNAQMLKVTGSDMISGKD